MAGMLVGIHAMLAMRLDAPELMIERDEATDYLRHAQNVMRHYSVETTQKTIDWIMFIGATAGTYGTRIVALAMRRNQQRPSGEVIQFPQNVYQGGPDHQGDGDLNA